MLLLAGAGLLYWFYHNNKNEKTKQTKTLIPNDATPLGYPQTTNLPAPDFTVKVSGIKKHLTPHMI
jgi:hypothetical protein